MHFRIHLFYLKCIIYCWFCVFIYTLQEDVDLEVLMLVLLAELITEALLSMHYSFQSKINFCLVNLQIIIKLSYSKALYAIESILLHLGKGRYDLINTIVKHVEFTL